jgi:DNA-directed RNA polymerase subunit M/transcription elongation factor TFIIS
MADTELVYIMRTCAAALLDSKGAPSAKLICDTIEALVVASNRLGEPEPLGEPMPVIEKYKAAQHDATWGGQLPPVKAQPCPSCGSIDARTVTIADRRLMLTCPTCTHQWEYGRAA